MLEYRPLKMNSPSFRGHIGAGERGGSARLLQEKKQAQTSRTHDHQPGCLRFRLQSSGGAVLHHFMVLESQALGRDEAAVRRIGTSSP